MKSRKSLSWLVMLVSVALAKTAYAYDYPDAVRDRPIILAAAKTRGISMDNLEFPLGKQVFTALITALAKIPELLGYVVGINDRFVTLHIITFNSQGKRYTCGAYVATLSNNTWEAEVSICGQEGTAFFNGEVFFAKTSVTPGQVGRKISGNLTDQHKQLVLNIEKVKFD